MTNFELMANAYKLFENFCYKLGLEPYDQIGLGFSENKVWGRAYWRKGGDAEQNFVDLNLQWHRMYPRELANTIVHELVHISLSLDGKNDGHRQNFKRMMYSLGFSSNATKMIIKRPPVVGIRRS